MGSRSLKSIGGLDALVMLAGSLLVLALVSCDDATSPERPSHSITLLTHFDNYGGADIEFSPSGKVLAAVTNRGVTVLDSSLGDTLLTYRWPMTSDEITGQDCAFNQDGSLVAACLNEAVVVLDVRARRPLLYREYLDGPPSMIGAIAFVPGQPALLIGGQMPMAYVLDYSTGELTSSILIGHSVFAVEVLPRGDTAAISLVGTGDPIMLWDLEHNTLVDSLSQHCDSYSVCLASSKNYFVAGCGGHSLLVWDQKLASYYGTIEGNWALAFSASHLTSLLVTSAYHPSREATSTSTIVLIDLSTRLPVHSWEAHTSAGLYDTAFSDDGTLIATAGYDGVINIWSHQAL